MLDQFFRDLVHGEFSVGKRKFAFLDILLVICITGAGVMIRSAIFGIAEDGVNVADSQRMLYCVLDFVLAVLMVQFVWMTTNSRLKTVGVYSLAVIWPAIAANSALNGGAEVGKVVLTLIILCNIAAKKHYDKKSFWLVTFFVCIAQALCADSFGEKLTNFWPNIYTLFSERGFVPEYGVTGKLLVIGILLLIFYYISKLDFQVTPELLVSSALFFSLFIGLFFPFMNYRSGLPANVFGLLLFLQNKKKWYVPVAMCTISYASYGFYYNGETAVMFWIYAMGQVVLMLDAGVLLYRQLHTGKTA